MTLKKDLVEDPNEVGAYYSVHISKNETARIAGIGLCRVSCQRKNYERYDPFAYRIVEVIKPIRSNE
jgi:hypothetical protein